MAEDQTYQNAREIVELALSKKAKHICLLDLRGLSNMTDFFIICHGDSDVQVKAIADAISMGMKKMGEYVWHKEGYDFLHWVLLDYVDIVVHVFEKETRAFYALERFWGDAKQELFGEAE